MKCRVATLLCLLNGLVLLACVELAVAPTDVQTAVNTAGEGITTGDFPPPPTGTDPDLPASAVTLTFQATLEGPILNSITITIGEPVTVFVIARDSSGAEIESTDLTASVRDESVAFVREISGRTVSFGGLAVGGTTATVRAAGVSKELPIAVVEP